MPSRRSFSKKDPHYPPLWVLAVAVFAMAVSFFQFSVVETSVAASDSIFSKGFSFFKIDFRRLFNSDLFLSHSTSLMRQRNMDCTQVSEACQREYRRCLGTLKDADQFSDLALQRARNGCIYGCAGEPEPCFGLDLNTVAKMPAPSPKPVSELQCQGLNTRACKTFAGESGTQTAVSCNGTTGQWVFGDCKATFVPKTCSGPTEQTCVTADGRSGSQQASLCDPNTGKYTWGTCVGSPKSNCPTIDPKWRVCELNDASWASKAWGREYVDYCNEKTGTWVYRPCNIYPGDQPQCTSFTYSDWLPCSNGKQGRSVLTRSPYGCYGGNSETIKSCTK